MKHPLLPLSHSQKWYNNFIGICILLIKMKFKFKKNQPEPHTIHRQHNYEQHYEQLKTKFYNGIQQIRNTTMLLAPNVKAWDICYNYL